MTTIVLLPPVPPGQLRTVRLREADSIPPRGLGCVHGRIQLVQEFFDRVLAPVFSLMHTHAHGYQQRPCAGFDRVIRQSPAYFLRAARSGSGITVIQNEKELFTAVSPRGPLSCQ
jgi:hypothetical protein